MGNKLLNSLENGAICVAFQTHFAKKENIQGWDAVSLDFFQHDSSLCSESSEMEKKM